MIDRNKLNRIQGILSARLGAEIPKFTPGGPLDIPFYILNGKFFLDGKEVTKEKFFKDKRVLESQKDLFKDITNEDKYLGANAVTNLNSKESLNGETPATEIIGDLNLTPNTSVEENAQLIEKTKEATEELIAEIKAGLSEEVKKAFDPAAPMSPNDPPKLADLARKAAVPEKLEKLNISAGLNIKNEEEGEEEEKEEKTPWISEKTAGKIGEYATKGLLMVGDYFGAKQATTDSSLTKGADAVYDLASEMVKKMGPIGQVVGTAMGFAGTAGDIIQGLGGGTDQMTGTDKWMDSSFFSWNIGMINGFGGKRSDAFAADQDILASVGSSYGGTTEDINTAASKASKKYGLFSSGARRKANRQIADARDKLNLMGDISDEATDLRLAVLSMGELAGLSYSLMTDGGYNQKYTYAAKQGGIIEWNPIIELEWEPQIELNWELPEFKEGGSVNLVEELEWIPEFQEGGKTTNKYRTLEQLFEYAKKENPRFIQRLSETPRGIKFIDDDGSEAEGSHYLEWSTDKNGKAVIYPRIQEMDDKSLKFLSSNEAWNRAMKYNNVLIMEPQEAELFFAEDPEYYTAYKRGWPKFFNTFKQGGSIKDSDIPEIEETNQKNVIPEGALHKNKHHMEHAEGLTKKGIPVIDDDGELQAEIEHSEIIFTLEVTKKLEEYYDIFYSEESSNKEKEQAALDAGKLLVYQILENTEDRTGLIESCKKGGSLKLKTSTDDLIEEVLEWMPTIVIVELKEIKKENIKEDKKKSEKELMKEAIKEVLIELLTK